jgi:hypothetical protein
MGEGHSYRRVVSTRIRFGLFGPAEHVSDILTKPGVLLRDGPIEAGLVEALFGLYGGDDG